MTITHLEVNGLFNGQRLVVWMQRLYPLAIQKFNTGWILGIPTHTAIINGNPVQITDYHVINSVKDLHELKINVNFNN